MRIFTTRINELLKLVQIRSKSRLYTKKHEWLVMNQDENSGRVGISKYAQESLGDVVYIQLPEINQSFKQFDEVGAIESVKAASEISTPVSGVVIGVNEELEQKPGLVNTSYHDEGWLFDIRLTDKKELSNLMEEDRYLKYLEDGDV